MIYTELKDKYAESLKKLTQKYNLISVVRLFLIIAALLSIYYNLSSFSYFWTFLGISAVLSFVFVIVFHEKIRKEKDLASALLKINKDEEHFLKEGILAFENGLEFQETKHPYSFDIDIFGQNSLFQHLNRCETVSGKEKLAACLKKKFENDEILASQTAIVELKDKIHFRQKIQAYAGINKDNVVLKSAILKWINLNDTPLSAIVRILSFLIPVLLFAVIIGYFITKNEILLNAISYVFLFNLVILYSQLKKIRLQILNADKVREVLNQYGLILAEIEKEEFRSDKLIKLKNSILSTDFKASTELKKLTNLFGSLEAVQNLLGAIIFNGLFLFHLHTLYSLLQWKKKYASKIPDWMDAIAELEALNSLANFAYNNPDFCFPKINSEFKYEFSNLGHPLIRSEKRICNDLNLSNQPFIILTGSNMSGKSTFLRSVAINLVLSGAGSVVCAQSASVHPIPLFVSMRLQDSLAENESYFYAEIKRIQDIMSNLDKERIFVLLDEILRGTNSDDKRNGTVGVIKKMVQHQAIGAIATHDLEVCDTTGVYPEYLVNYCFEADIVSDNIHFDYKLRKGISKNKSATFLMKKLNIIE